MPATFSVHGWNYTHPAKQMAKLAKNVLSISDKDPQIFWKVGGGKGFGLCVCDAISLLIPNCAVPPWLGIDPANKAASIAALEVWQKSHPGKIITRSSHYKEDFQDSRSGVHDSFQFQYELNERSIDKIFSFGIPFVIQQHVNGIGFVIDVGYSRLLKKPVVKFAHGSFMSTESGTIFTSATWDFESRFGLYSVDGEPIIPLEEIVFQDIAPQMARSLVEALKKLEIGFGVQLEFIINPFDPLKWHLVQVRPSPLNVRGDLLVPKKPGTLIETSLRVNKVGSVAGRVISISTTRDTSEVSSLMEIARSGYDKSRYRKLRDKLNGNVVLWSDPGLTRSELVKLVFAASSVGAVGQVSFRTLFHNSWHKKVRIYAEEGQIKGCKEKKNNLIMAVSAQTHARMSAMAMDKKYALLISDGLVGQIFEI